jgi:hypothetical protein
MGAGNAVRCSTATDLLFAIFYLLFDDEPKAS